MRFDSLRAIALMRQPGLKTGGMQRPPRPLRRCAPPLRVSQRHAPPGLAGTRLRSVSSCRHSLTTAFSRLRWCGQEPPISPLAVQALRPQGNKKKGNIWKRQLGSQAGTDPPEGRPRGPRCPATLPGSQQPWAMACLGSAGARTVPAPEAGTSADRHNWRPAPPFHPAPWGWS